MGRKSNARLRLIEAAHDLVWESSYGAVTIASICERASVKKGSFYYFFESKSDLALAAINAWWDDRKPRVEQMFCPKVPPLERIGNYFDFVAQRQLEAYERDGRILGCPLFSLGTEISTQDERIRFLIHEILTCGFHYFEQAVRDAHESGEIETKNVPLTARLLWNFYEGTLSRARIENCPDLIRNLRADALELIGAHPDPALALN